MTEEDELAEMEQVESAPTEEISEAVESTETGEKDPEPSEEKKDEPSKKAQDRINKLTADKYELRRQLEERDKKLQEYQEQISSQIKKPSLDDPDINHDPVIYEQKLTEYIQSQTQTSGASQPEPGPSEKAVAFNTKVEEFKAEHPDYVNVVSQMPINQNTADAILEIDNGPAVAYHLANHLDLVDELNSMTAAAAALRINTLSQKLMPAETRTTQAPDPVGSVTSGGGSIPNKDLNKMSFEELDARDAERFTQAR